MSRFIRKIKKKIGMNLFWRIYFRLMIESFVGVLLVSINEIKTNKMENNSYVLSYIVAWVCLMIYTIFYLLVMFICFREVLIRRKKIKNMIHKACYEEPELEELKELPNLQGKFIDSDKIPIQLIKAILMKKNQKKTKIVQRIEITVR